MMLKKMTLKSHLWAVSTIQDQKASLSKMLETDG